MRGARVAARLDVRAERAKKEGGSRAPLPKVGDDEPAHEITTTVFDARYRSTLVGRMLSTRPFAPARLDTKWQSEHRLADPEGGDERRGGLA